MSVNTATSFLSIIFATILRTVLSRLNKKIQQGVRVEAEVYIPGDRKASHDARKKAVEDKGLPGEAVDRGFRFLL
jgi:hypothetical protein